jgi:photosystem II stability/assembly factor-like uncharacterized protein
MMKTRIRAAGIAGLAALAVTTLTIADAQEREAPVVDIKPGRIILLGADRAGERIVAVGERGIAMLSDDQGQSWRFVTTPTTRTLTGVAFVDDKTGVAVGHGASLVRTVDGGETWTKQVLEEAGIESLLGVTDIAGGRLLAYGAFGLYFVSDDGGESWRKKTVMYDDFDRHISQIVEVGDKLLMVAESGILARSDDRGETWIKLDSPYEGSFFGATAAGDGSVLAYGMRGNVYRSENFASAELIFPEVEEPDVEAEDYDEYAIVEPEGAAGVIWQKIPLDTTTSLMAGLLLSDGRILLVGNSGLLAESEDNGRDLHLHFAPELGDMSQVLEVDGKLISVGLYGIRPIEHEMLASQ